MIPIRNIYYLLCYAWDKLDEGKRLSVSESDYRDSLNLLTRVLLNGCEILFSRGLERAYVARTESYAGIKGKIDFGASLKSNVLRIGRAVCEFDEFEVDILSNQLLKATLVRLANLVDLGEHSRVAAWHWAVGMREVVDIDLDLSLFGRVRIHRNNSLYDFLLKICKLIAECSALDEHSGRHVFKEFTGNDKVMAALFESFIRNFYKRHRPTMFRGRENIRWSASSDSMADYSLLPIMQTDVTLESTERKIIIDAKYYSNALAVYYGSAKFHSPNLYQMYSYLRNVEADTSNSLNVSCGGILLYPTVDRELDAAYQFGTHPVRVATLNLNAPWREIEARLLNLAP
jgi:5-methylcytosine-specific restriction enzyme subunit McrC